jgi:hypothetical protein
METTIKYPEHVMKAVRGRLGYDEEDIAADTEINEMSADEVFEALVAWTLGYSSWADTIKNWVSDIYNVQLEG